MHKPNSPFLAYIYELMIMSRYSMSTIEALALDHRLYPL